MHLPTPGSNHNGGLSADGKFVGNKSQTSTLPSSCLSLPGLQGHYRAKMRPFDANSGMRPTAQGTFTVVYTPYE